MNPFLEAIQRRISNSTRQETIDHVIAVMKGEWNPSHDSEVYSLYHLMTEAERNGFFLAIQTLGITEFVERQNRALTHSS